MKWLTALMLCFVACSTPQQPPPSERLTKTIEKALSSGFRLEDQKGRKAELHTTPVSENWFWRSINDATPPIVIWSQTLSDKEHSDIVDIEEWHFADEAQAKQAAEAAQRFIKKEAEMFKTLYDLWADGSVVYYVSSRAFMFETQRKAIVSMMRSAE